MAVAIDTAPVMTEIRAKAQKTERFRMKCQRGIGTSFLFSISSMILSELIFGMTVQN
ncbi:MAG TPA: hypothetical protein DEB17_05775 [Chlorobaculum sp.]|uniref:Uncharacterized protein n=1 Tax=Chlorobaculum tepidum (strain ATCC 49652 / DSM 12025 / NBRC 103806 / TLS) TaxID=194439 RepID=Q8KF29_CHLTE|nr:hypothetical protein CT0503 [Chlorobaculum tepidum TLS]HBU23494.1 hypothetical protein [Chlorobaculum sp.]